MRRLPKLAGKSINSMTKKYAVNTILNYQDGLKKNNFRLERLKDATIKQKTNEGLSRPRSPLYGKGEDEERSLFNALVLKRQSNGWKIVLSRKKHHKADLTLAKLLMIHENGAIIKRDDVLIRIPPRPARIRALSRTLRQMKKEESAKKVRRAMARYINDNKKDELIKMQRLSSRERRVREGS
jgi:hypothetical protein